MNKPNNLVINFLSILWTVLAPSFAINIVIGTNIKKAGMLIKPLFTTSSINISSSSSGEVSLDTTTLADEIKKLNELYKSGVLTKDEFEQAKKKLLN